MLSCVSISVLHVCILMCLCVSTFMCSVVFKCVSMCVCVFCVHVYQIVNVCGMYEFVYVYVGDYVCLCGWML